MRIIDGYASLCVKPGYVRYAGKDMTAEQFSKKFKLKLSDRSFTRLQLDEDSKDLSGLESIGIQLEIISYNFQLPNLKSATNLYVSDYKFDLPELAYVKKLTLYNNKSKMPNLKAVSILILEDSKAPKSLEYIGYTSNNDIKPLKCPNLIEVGDGMVLTEFGKLPKLKTVYGEITLDDYEHKLPSLVITRENIENDFMRYYKFANKLRNVVVGETDQRDFQFFAVYLVEDKEWRIRAGCRNYSIGEAKAHWTKEYCKDHRRSAYGIVRRLIKKIEKYSIKV